MGYLILTALTLVGWFTFVFPWDPALLLTHLPGDGGDEISFLFIFERLGTNLWSLAPSLFDGKFLYPSTDSLIYSETMMAPSMLYRALLPLASTRFAAFGFTIFLLLWMNAISMYWCAKKFFAPWLAMALALIFTFSVIRLAHMCHAHCMPQWGYPIVAGLIVDYERSHRKKYLLWAGVATALQFYFSVSLGTILVVTLLPYCLFRCLPKASRQVHGMAFLQTIGIFALLALPLGLPYVLAAQKYHFTRSLHNAVAYGANPKSYFVVPRNHRYAGWLVDGIFGGENGARHEKCLFIGFSVMALFYFGWRSLKLTAPKEMRRIYYGTLWFVILISMGWNIGLYNLMYYLFPLMRGIRTPARFGMSYLFLALFLAGFGLTYLLRRIARPWQKAVLLCTLFILVILDNQFRPPIYPLDPALEGAAHRLAQTGDRKPVLHLPIYGKARMQSMQMYYSLVHDHPIANGYSGFLPKSYDELAGASVEFLEGRGETLFPLLRQYGIPYVLLEKEQLGANTSELATKIKRRGFTEIYQDDKTILLFATNAS